MEYRVTTVEEGDDEDSSSFVTASEPSQSSSYTGSSYTGSRSATTRSSQGESRSMGPPPPPPPSTQQQQQQQQTARSTAEASVSSSASNRSDEMSHSSATTTTPSRTGSFATDSYSGSFSYGQDQDESIMESIKEEGQQNQQQEQFIVRRGSSVIESIMEHTDDESSYEQASTSIRPTPLTLSLHSQQQSSSHSASQRQQQRQRQQQQPRQTQTQPRRKTNTQCKSIAVLGTMSDAGKSVIAAGLCRILANGGIRVAPFKAQNMSNNASPALLPDSERRKALYESFSQAVGGAASSKSSKHNNGHGMQNPLLRRSKDYAYGEIGTAQALQAEACRQVPRVEMNPVLLKSGGKNKKGEYLCSVVVLGQQIVRETYGDLGKRTTSLRRMVLECHDALADATAAEAIVIEGAGSCTELNLMERDIVNLPLVRELGCPWILVANIDPGGVFAQIVGTKMCVSERDWSLCVGVVVNKLRGEAKYFEPGPKMLQDMVGKPVFVVPFLNDLNLPEEDGLGIERRLAWESSGPSGIDKQNKDLPLVLIVAYPHTAIADDICPLERDSRFRVQWRRRRIPNKAYPHVSAIILPGSRLTRLDLKWLHDSGWVDYIRKHVTAGGTVLGLCGGYQMLGWTVEDPMAVEGSIGSKQGLGLLPIDTTLAPAECKIVVPRKGHLFSSKIAVEGFELHCGQSRILEQVNGTRVRQQIHPLLSFSGGRPEGMCSGRVRGTYLHGILRSPEARAELLVSEKDDFPTLKQEEKDPLDQFARHLESCGLDFDTLKSMMANDS